LSDNTPLDCALDFAKRGYYVFPVKKGNSKEPCEVGWQNKSTVDPAEVRTMAARHPDCNWGLDCDKSGLSIIDIDCKPGRPNGYETIKALPPVESPFTVLTPSGGQHRYFRGSTKSTASVIGPSVDSKSKGGYVLIPGSVVDGGVYTITSDAAKLPFIPMWVTDRLGPLPAPKDPLVDTSTFTRAPDTVDDIIAAAEYLATEAKPAEKRVRDDTCLRVGRKLGDLNITIPTAIKLMLSVYSPKIEYDHDFTEADVRKCVVQAYKNRESPLGCASVNVMFASGKEETISICEAERARLTKRQWLMRGRYIKGFTTATVAPGGTGKSSLVIVEALAMATGKNLTFSEVSEPGNVWYINTEDPMDELRRRIIAAADHHRIPLDALEGKLTVTSKRMKLVTDDPKKGMVINHAAVAELVQGVRERDIKLLIVDPFVRCHSVKENDNDGIDLVLQQFQDITEETGCAVSLVHHMSKGKADPGNADKSRGATAFISSVRVAHTLYTMTDKEAAQFNVPIADSDLYRRLDSAKANMSRKSKSPHWFKMQTRKMFFDDEDVVAVPEMAVLEYVSAADEEDLLREEVAGRILREGEKTIYSLAAGILSDAKDDRRPRAAELSAMVGKSGQRGLENRIKHAFPEEETVTVVEELFERVMITGSTGKSAAGIGRVLVC